mmetsp:Transcript_22421/g.51677  ORF Transcript_22421/g.51677 Transcript_22421/m.51677 type:complete len:95 (-) Transcript_22421:194-478(-)
MGNVAKPTNKPMAVETVSNSGFCRREVNCQALMETWRNHHDIKGCADDGWSLTGLIALLMLLVIDCHISSIVAHAPQCTDYQGKFIGGRIPSGR